MRFDLEIANLHTDLVYISENQEIPAGAVPLYFINMDTRDKVPSDFFSLEDNILKDTLAGQGYQAIEGPAFTVNGSKFLLTHVSTYSVQGNAKVPLFYKHVIADNVHEDAIRIVDFFGIQIPREEYLVEEKQDFTNIYINKYNKVLFVEYVSENRIYKKLLDIQPIFTEIGWEDFVVLDTNVPAYKYMITDNFVQTSYPGTMYIAYKYETDLLRMPVCNIDSDWYLGILNANFTIDKAVEPPGGGAPVVMSFRYSVPEYYAQQTGADRYYKNFVNVKAKKLFDNYIQLQTPILRERAESIYIYVYDFYSGTLKYAVSTNKKLNGRLVPKSAAANGQYVNDVYYMYTDNYNGDGIIGLPVRLSENDVCYATYSIFDEFYELRLLNLNSPTLNNGGYFGIYLLPDVTEMEESVYFARIGIPITVKRQPGLFEQGMQFETLSEYYEFIDANNLYNVAVISIFGNYEASILNTKDARIKGGEIIDRKLACEKTADMLYKDMIEGNINIPTNDTLIACLDAVELNSRGVINIDKETFEQDVPTTEFLAKVKDVVQKNLDASSSAIIETSFWKNSTSNADFSLPPSVTTPPPDLCTITITVPSAARSGNAVVSFVNAATGVTEIVPSGADTSTVDFQYYKGTEIIFNVTYDWFFVSIDISSSNGSLTTFINSSDGQTTTAGMGVGGDTTYSFNFSD